MYALPREPSVAIKQQNMYKSGRVMYENDGISFLNEGINATYAKNIVANIVTLSLSSAGKSNVYRVNILKKNIGANVDINLFIGLLCNYI
jgi:hypothetical protein